jgi:hypothetical protein
LNFEFKTKIVSRTCERVQEVTRGVQDSIVTGLPSLFSREHNSQINEIVLEEN